MGDVETTAATPPPEVVDRGEPLLAAGTIVDDDFRIERLLGTGGMGVVYLARDLRLERDVALKVHNALGATAAQRLAREATAMARISHPNVVAVHRVGELGGAVFVAMELIDGGTVRSWLGTPRTPREIVAMYCAAGEGLAAAHAAGLIHRDFKPDNVLVGADGRPRVADFGLATSSLSAGGADEMAQTMESGGETPLPRMTATGAWVGTPAYMAPEQWERGAADARSDQFSFAIALWEALHGQRPFRGDRIEDLRAALDQPPEPAVRGRVLRHVDAALRRALARDLDARYPTMKALVAALRDDPAARWRTRGAVVVGVGLLGVAVAAVAFRGGDERIAPCRDAGEVATAWGPERRAALEHAFAAIDAPWARDVGPRVAAALDARAATWTEVSLRACRASRVERTWTDDIYARSRGCLARRLGELDATSALLAGGDRALAVRAVDIVNRLPDATACTDLALLAHDRAPPKDPELAAAIATAERGLARVQALADGGRYKDAALAADALVAEATRLGDDVFAARAARARAVVANLRSEPDAPARLEDAYYRARRAGLFPEAADAALALSVLLSERMDPEAAERWWRLAEADVAGFQLGRSLEGSVARAHASVLDRAGQYKAARDEAGRALEIALAIHGETDHEQVTAALNGVAVLEEALGNHTEAIALMRRVLAADERRLGSSHPDLMNQLSNLGLSLTSAGEHTEAVAMQTRALTLARASGAPGVNVASILLNLGVALSEARRYEEGIVYVREAIATLTPTEGADNAVTLLARAQLGSSLMSTGAHDEARKELEPALADARRALGEDHDIVGLLLANVGENELQSGHAARARPFIEESVAVYRKASGFPDELAYTLCLLAQIQVEARDGARAVASAEEGLRLFAGTGVNPERVARCELNLAHGLWLTGDHARARSVAADADSHVKDDAALKAQITALRKLVD